ncbi:MAG TPA: DNA-directed RNA polymerase subunit delta [Clostridiales bacterium]|nr:DNA-directed RNA polymerase subunit delta [Clostridiales bacterium]
MGELSYQLPRDTVGDVACALLRQRGEPMPIKELLPAIAASGLVRAETPARAAAIIHTEINLDGRLTHLGGGMWGLRQWSSRHDRDSRRASAAVEPPEGEFLPQTECDPGDADARGAYDEGWPEHGERWDE